MWKIHRCKSCWNVSERETHGFHLLFFQWMFPGRILNTYSQLYSFTSPYTMGIYYYTYTILHQIHHFWYFFFFTTSLRINQALFPRSDPMGSRCCARPVPDRSHRFGGEASGARVAHGMGQLGLRKGPGPLGDVKSMGHADLIWENPWGNRFVHGKFDVNI